MPQHTAIVFAAMEAKSLAGTQLAATEAEGGGVRPRSGHGRGNAAERGTETPRYRPPATLALTTILLALASCAHTPPPSPPPAVVQQHEEEGRYALAKLLVDACTDEETNEERISIVDFVLRTCHLNPVACIRKACHTIAGPHCRRPWLVER